MTIKQRVERLAAESIRTARIEWLAHRFRSYRRMRQQRFGTDFTHLSAPGTPGLVSIVLPVYNGEDLVAAAIESVLAQDHPDWELLIINDGSQDRTAHIIEEYAAADPRVLLFHQENRKIPKTLSRGFRMARGQYLTWTSADNRLRPSFLRLLMGCLERHPDWDLVYANQDIIDEKGLPLRASSYFANLQTPPGSEHLHLPERTDILHAGENFIGAAFMYRSRVAQLLGDYSSQRFTVEDYDYWLRANTLCNVHHVDFTEPVYEYRFHDRSLTAQAQELRIAESREQLLVFDGFRQELCLRPLQWICESSQTTGRSVLMRALDEQLRSLGHTLWTREQLSAMPLPSYCLPMVYLQLGSALESLLPPPADLPKTALTVFWVRDAQAPDSAHHRWDLVAALGPGSTPRLGQNRYQGLLRATDLPTLIRAIDARCRAESLRRIEVRTAERTDPQTLTVLLDGDQSDSQLRAMVHSLLLQELRHRPCEADESHRQTGSIAQLEVLIVRRNAKRRTAEHVFAILTDARLGSVPIKLRFLDYPLPGPLLHWTLHAALSEASGAVLCVPGSPLLHPHYLEDLFELFARRPKLALLQESQLGRLPRLRLRSFAARTSSLLLAGGLRCGPRSLFPSVTSALAISSQLQRLGCEVAQCSAPFKGHSSDHSLRVLSADLRAVHEVIAQTLQGR